MDKMTLELRLQELENCGLSRYSLETIATKSDTLVKINIPSYQGTLDTLAGLSYKVCAILASMNGENPNLLVLGRCRQVVHCSARHLVFNSALRSEFGGCIHGYAWYGDAALRSGVQDKVMRLYNT